MFFTSFGRIDDDKKKIIFDMLLPIIETDKPIQSKSSAEFGDKTISDYVSIAKLSSFIDFFNYFPFMIQDIKHKNDTSEDMYLYMGATATKKISLEHLNDEEMNQLKFDTQQLKKLLALISFKINERFKNLKNAFRYFDNDH
jgi:hypothetical protein